MSTVVLYNYFRSSASYRVRTALALKGIAYEYRAVKLVTPNGEGEQCSADYRSNLNPKAEVPVLLIDGVRLTQSLPIIEYLEETRPNQGEHLLPSDPVARAHSRRLAEIINSGIQPLQNLSVLLQLPEGERQAWAAGCIRRGFEALEAELVQTSGIYCVGDAVSIADLCLVPQVMNADRFKVDMAPFPTIKRIHAALVELPAFKKAHPLAQPDAPAKTS